MEKFFFRLTLFKIYRLKKGVGNDDCISTQFYIRSRDKTEPNQNNFI